MEKRKTLPLICVIGMPIIMIIANAMANLYIKVADSFFSVSVVLYPLIYLIMGLIIRKTSYKDALRMLLVTIVSATLGIVVQWILCDSPNANVAIYSFLSSIICGLIFIFVYDFLIKTKVDNYFTIFILVFGIMLIDTIFFGTFVEGTLNSYSLLVRAIYILIMPAMLCKPLISVNYVKEEDTDNNIEEKKEKKKEKKEEE